MNLLTSMSNSQTVLQKFKTSGTDIKLYKYLTIFQVILLQRHLSFNN